MRCEYCGKTIHVSIYKNTKHCSELCRKALVGEITEEEWYTAMGVKKGG